MIFDSDSRQRLGMTIQQLHNQIEELKGKSTAYSHRASQWGSEKAAYDQQIAQLNDKLVRAQQNLDNALSENRQLVQV